MRLWHTLLIDVLPRAQLISQWRECAAIAGAIRRNGTPNHLLVNFVLDYDFDNFISYAGIVREEMYRRGYAPTEAVWRKIQGLKTGYASLDIYDIYSDIMDNEYLTICYYNIYEKYLRGGVSEEEWQEIQYRVSDLYE